MFLSLRLAQFFDDLAFDLGFLFLKRPFLKRLPAFNDRNTESLHLGFNLYPIVIGRDSYLCVSLSLDDPGAPR